METGIQVSSLKPLLLTEAQVQAVFCKLRALGCSTVQLQWIDSSVPSDAIAAALRKNGLRSVSVQDLYETVQEHFGYYVNLNVLTGGRWLCVSRIPQRFRSREGLNAFLAELQAMQARLVPWGQNLCFHPVSADFTAVPGIRSVDYLLEAIPELELCLDLYHLNRCCDDMPAYIRRYTGRICMVHFKDSFGDILVPAGQGDTNWTGVVRACLDAGVPYAFVEQERWQGDPFVCLKDAMDWLEREKRR
ncbi:MAG: sugar phosphate isomerase/epimerase family protein [Faecousia sp.]